MSVSTVPGAQNGSPTTDRSTWPSGHVPYANHWKRFTKFLLAFVCVTVFVSVAWYLINLHHPVLSNIIGTATRREGYYPLLHRSSSGNEDNITKKKVKASKLFADVHYFYPQSNTTNITAYSLADRESFGFYKEVLDSDWQLRRSVYLQQRAKQELLPTTVSQPGHEWFQDHWEPEWSCQLEQRVGRMGDGGKWVCDLPRITDGDCLVYSIGSSDEWSFEEDIHRQLHCDIFTFDHTSTWLWKPSFVNFYPWGLAGPQRPAQHLRRAAHGGMKDLNEIVEELGHWNREIDILKIDIESGEYGALLPLLKEAAVDRKREKEAAKLSRGEEVVGKEEESIRQHRDIQHDIVAEGWRGKWRRFPAIRQVLIEVHIGLGGATAEQARQLLSSFGELGYAVFHKEPNIKFAKGACTEYSLLYLNIDNEDPQ